MILMRMKIRHCTDKKSNLYHIIDNIEYKLYYGFAYIDIYFLRFLDKITLKREYVM